MMLAGTVLLLLALLPGAAMHWMTMHGVMNGMDDGTLAPKANATRAQIAAMFMRFAAEMEK